MIYYLGDIHGDYNVLLNGMDKLKKGDTLIQVGDFGLGFRKGGETDVLHFIGKEAERLGIHVYAIRGNHDDPLYFNGSKYGGLTLLEDYSVIKIEGQNILFIGGGISIDRVWRLEKRHPYWANEKVVYKPNVLKKISGIDIVVTHTAPMFCFPVGFNDFVKSFFKDDPFLERDLIQERELMSNIFTILRKKNKIKKWVYGHFHNESKEIHEGTAFHLLNIDQISICK